MSQLQYQNTTPYETLVPGLQQIGPISLYNQCVKTFHENPTRRKIFSGFTRYIKTLHKMNVLVAVIINGSFVSKKPDPCDIDVSIVFDANVIGSLTGNDSLRFKHLTCNDDIWQRQNQINYHTHPFNCIPVWGNPSEYQKDTSKKIFETAVGFWAKSKDNSYDKGMLIVYLNRKSYHKLEVLFS
ncbi:MULTISPECIES: DUF6932 family protein [Synergistaceae]|uniref:DUF6932 family protein n=1 Tax=Synergistaceae TaxID=649777 RepID=UPI003AE4062A|nr:hypothetical protein [Synergistaceae bacterium DZ-S4]